MILQALTAYYEQLVRQGKLSAPGWDDSFKVSYELRLNDAGQLLRVVPLLTEKTVGKKTVLAPRAIAYRRMKSVPPALPPTSCAITPLICWVRTKKASRSALRIASRPVPNCITPFWTV